MAANALPLLTLRASLEGKAVRALVSDHRCNLGSVTGTGTGGSITIKSPNATITKLHQLVAISPSGVLKERIAPEGMYALFGSRSVLSIPSLKRYPLKPPRCMNSVPLFLKAGCYQCLHDAAFSYSPLGSPKQIQRKERHQSASVQAGLLNGNNDPQPSIRCIVLDIEGTTTPITYVTDILFPYARDNVRKHLMSTYDSEETNEDIKLLRAQVEDDLEKGVPGAVPIPPDDVGKQEVIDSLVTNVEAMIKADRKITSLKQLQGHIWRTGFENKELQGAVYEDVPEALQKWHANGIKVYIYSSGSREAQRLIYGNTSYGDLRKYLCGFFDTTVGNKRESRSYFEISQSLGVDKPSEILFITDVYQEAMAAKVAGLEVLISIRPGNAPLPENHGFRTIKSFAEI